MKKIVTCLVLIICSVGFAQVGIGTNNPNPSAALDITSRNKALLYPRVANTAAVVAPVNGMMIYDISSGCVKGFENGNWTNCLSNGASIESSTNGTAIVRSYNCNIGSVGVLTRGVVVGGVTQIIEADVTQPGSYSISAVANGVLFIGSGTLVTTGLQNIVLTAAGTPTATGSNTFTLNTTPNCNFSRTTF
ncbi:hypothetical protein [Flavobacterium succinicans]|uniref:Uncharacterized protein n=1 Tax=Flavobacterium succinicans TaxID=29536 RepID=A0A199XSC3_9FLAO|nr:hypothetical protein [Flavobacterium succinicans]OAZ04545.1 hypothetical protein FLB_10620 [Flavobacterium succinicans]